MPSLRTCSTLDGWEDGTSDCCHQSHCNEPRRLPQNQCHSWLHITWTPRSTINENTSDCIKWHACSNSDAPQFAWLKKNLKWFQEKCDWWACESKSQIVQLKTEIRFLFPLFKNSDSLINSDEPQSITLCWLDEMKFWKSGKTRTWLHHSSLVTSNLLSSGCTTNIKGLDCDHRMCHGITTEHWLTSESHTTHQWNETDAEKHVN